MITGINDNGVMIGSYYNGAGPQANSVVIANTANGYTYNIINDPNATNGTVATSINNNGEIAGYYVDANNVAHGFLYNSGTYTTFDEPNSTAGTYIQGINNIGELIGTYNTSNGSYGFIYDPKTKYYTTMSINAVGGGDVHPTGINDNGQVSGWFVNSIGQIPFVYGITSHAYKTLDLPITVVPGSFFVNANGINNNGQIIGLSYNGKFQGFIASPNSPVVPLPSAFWLFGSVFGLSTLARHKCLFV